MCDTVCSLQGDNRDTRISLFGKNSDRDPNEIQVVEFYPRTIRNGKVHATYIDVEYEGKTNAVILSRPQWMWGAEMGVNEKGVAVGNEAIFAPPKNKKQNLLGMDLLRLGLERGDDAISVAATIIEYLETYGQGGSNHRSEEEYYNNLYLITDLRQALQLTIIGKEYSLERTGSHYSISNKMPEPDAEKREKVRVSPDFSSKEDFLYTKLGHGMERSRFTSETLKAKSGTIQVRDIFQMLRHHEGSWSDPRKGTNRDVCMHAGPLSRKFQTVNSMVAETTEKGSVIWSTFSSNPCISLYKPILFSGNSIFGLSYGADYWLRSEKVHRNCLSAYSTSIVPSREELDKTQTQMIDASTEVRNEWLFGEAVPHLENGEIFKKINEIDDRYLSSLSGRTVGVNTKHSGGFYGNWWRKKEESLSGSN